MDSPPNPDFRRLIVGVSGALEAHRIPYMLIGGDCLRAGELKMNSISLQVTYRKGRPFAAYIYLDRRPGDETVRTEEVTSDLVVDYGEDGRALGIEVITPGAVGVEEIFEVFDRFGLGRPSESELEPLRAA